MRRLPDPPTTTSRPSKTSRPPAPTIKTELAKVIVGQDEVIDEILISIFTRSHALLVGVPGLAKTLMISSLAQTLHLGVQAHPVHARPDAVGHHRHGGDLPGPGDRRAPVQVPQGPDLRQHRPGRRDQPHAAQDAGGDARGDAGAEGDASAVWITSCPSRSSCWRRRTRSSRKGRIRCPRRSSTGSCS